MFLSSPGHLGCSLHREVPQVVEGAGAGVEEGEEVEEGGEALGVELPGLALPLHRGQVPQA